MFANMDSVEAILKCSTSGDFLDYVAISEERLIRKNILYFSITFNRLLYEIFKFKKVK